MSSIAVLINVCNHREQALECLAGCYRQFDTLAAQDESLSFSIYVHDDAGTDGLPEAVRERFPQVHLMHSDSVQYWCTGLRKLWEEAASEVEATGGRVLKGKGAIHLTVDGAGKVTSVECADGSSYPCDVCMSTMPLKDLAAAMDNVPADVAAVAEGLPYRDFVTVGLLVPRLELKNETDIRTLGNIVPDNWIYVQDTGVKLGRIQVFNNWSPYLVADPEHTVWVGLEYFCAEGDDFWNMPDEERVPFAKNELVKMGVLSGGTELLDSHVELVKKAYPAYFDTYDKIDQLIAWLDTHPNLFCMGRNGQHRYNNMDHSMMTAFYAVDDLLAGVTDRSNVWNVNTDTDYAEEKSDEPKS